jgi:hypothetical protein
MCRYFLPTKRSLFTQIESTFKASKLAPHTNVSDVSPKKSVQALIRIFHLPKSAIGAVSYQTQQNFTIPVQPNISWRQSEPACLRSELSWTL